MFLFFFIWWGVRNDDRRQYYDTDSEPLLLSSIHNHFCKQSPKSVLLFFPQERLKTKGALGGLWCSMEATDNQLREIKRKKSCSKVNKLHLQTGVGQSGSARWGNISLPRLRGHWLRDCWGSTKQPAGRDRWACTAGTHRQRRLCLCSWGHVIPGGWETGGQWIMSDTKPLGKQAEAFVMIWIETGEEVTEGYHWRKNQKCKDLLRLDKRNHFFFSFGSHLKLKTKKKLLCFSQSSLHQVDFPKKKKTKTSPSTYPDLMHVHSPSWTSYSLVMSVYLGERNQRASLWLQVRAFVRQGFRLLPSSQCFNGAPRERSFQTGPSTSCGKLNWV